DGYLAPVSAIEILGLPSVDGHRRVVYQALRLDPLFERGKIDNRLERRARLATRLGDTIELALVIGPSTDHRLDGTVAIKGNERSLANPTADTPVVQPLSHRFFRNGLQTRIQGGENDDIVPEVRRPIR